MVVCSTGPYGYQQSHEFSPKQLHVAELFLVRPWRGADVLYQSAHCVGLLKASHERMFLVNYESLTKDLIGGVPTRLRHFCASQHE